MPMKIAESWNKIGEQMIKEEVLSEIKSRYGELWNHPTGGLKKAKKIYVTNHAEGAGDH
jgi:hypothetical protein